MTSIQQLILAICIASNSANIYGAVIFTATEKPSGVVFQGVGSLDVSSLELRFRTAFAVSSALYGTPPSVDVGPPRSIVALYTGTSLNGPNSIGPRDSLRQSDRSAGDFFGITFLLPVSSATPAIVVPSSYVSGTRLSGSAEYNGENFATLGITPGIYTWKWGPAGRTDTLTVRIVPEPSGSVLWLAGAIWTILTIHRHLYLSSKRFSP
jgi:hypothetical protein